jgi:ATP-dependent DNA ligase
MFFEYLVRPILFSNLYQMASNIPANQGLQAIVCTFLHNLFPSLESHPAASFLHLGIMERGLKMFLPPMLLEKRENPFDDERYLFEPKIDGHRLILSMENGDVRLFTRHNYEVTMQYPELHNVSIEDNSDVVLDGEVACLNPESGSIEFEMIMERFMLKKPIRI